jgi:hypothetical protein
MGTAVNMYVQDYDETYAPRRGCGPPVGTSANGHWGFCIQPYQKNFGVFICPSNPVSNQNARGVPIPDNGARIRRSYGINGWIFDGEVFGLKQASVQAPAQQILIAEHTASHDDFAGYWWGRNTYRDNGYAGHAATWNLVYFDGHAKNKRPTQVIANILEFPLNATTNNPADCPQWRSGNGAAYTQAQCVELIEGMRLLEARFK